MANCRPGNASPPRSRFAGLASCPCAPPSPPASTTEDPLSALELGEPARAGPARRLGDGGRPGQRAQPPRPVVAAGRRAARGPVADDPRLRRRRGRPRRQRGRRVLGGRPAHRRRPGGRSCPSTTRGPSPSGSPYPPGTWSPSRPSCRSPRRRACRRRGSPRTRCWPRGAGCPTSGAVLVQGAGGGVATAAVVLAVALGARVYATSRDADKRERIAALGATAAGNRRPAARTRRRGDRDGRRGDLRPLDEVRQAGRADRRLRRHRGAPAEGEPAPGLRRCSWRSSAR